MENNMPQLDPSWNNFDAVLENLIKLTNLQSEFVISQLEKLKQNVIQCKKTNKIKIKINLNIKSSIFINITKNLEHSFYKH